MRNDPVLFRDAKPFGFRPGNPFRAAEKRQLLVPDCDSSVKIP